ncbi:MAG: DNA/pantothenate metabolism flavoprotein [Leptospiraceae bacterium]|nr:MAG: DNA/pantothenate metabolism flavoprotein [Leptospiraceae bacterium]
MKVNHYNPHYFKLIVTSGPTREWIDPVRFISNPSSGKTGYFLAKKGLNYYREVVYIAGYAEKEYKNVEKAKNISVDTTNSMAEAVFNELEDYTILIMAAAPADYTPKLTSNIKLKKQEEEKVLHLMPTIDILKTVGTQKISLYNKLILIGFAAETNHVREYALEKLNKKNAHFICANQVFKNQSGFGNIENTIVIYDKWNQEKKIGPYPKEILCDKIIEYLNQRIAEVFDRI